MIKYMMIYKEDSTKGLAYERILTRIFARCNVPFDGIVGTCLVTQIA